MVEEKKSISKGKIGLIIAIVVFILIVVVFVGLLIKNNSDSESIDTYEKEQLASFETKMLETYEKAKTMDYETAQEFIVSDIYDNAEIYGGNDSVDYLSNQLLTTTMSDTTKSVEDLIKSLQDKSDKVVSDLVDGVLNGGNDDIVKTSITMRSNTVCNDGDIDQKFCVEKLNARVYIVDKNSDKWAILVHGNMMSGSLMYSSVGDMYTSQGYNVLAPDLRGFGSSDGSVAMGYLESLDVYDWIKDLNANWNDSSRYGVSVKPQTIVVHGVSLGGATTLQLATNPDIAAAAGDPYTSNLTQLNVKGFVDDCGYTSMSGIITGMLSMGDTLELSSLLGSLDIDLDSFMSEFNKVASAEKVSGFENFDANSLKDLDFAEMSTYLEQFSDVFGQVEEEFNKYQTSNGSYEIPGYDKNTIDELINKYSSLLENSGFDPNGIQRRETESDNNAVLEGLIGKVLMNLVGVGLNDDNYAKYSDVFSSGRSFVNGSKVMVIHGTADTTVPHSNADTVAANVSPATLVHKWDADLQPHAFIVVGANKSEYTNLIANYLKCIDDVNCTSVSR